MKDWALYVRKGLIAVGGGLAQLALALAPASDAGAAVTPAEWVQVGLAALTALGVVAFSNGPRPGGDGGGDHVATGADRP